MKRRKTNRAIVLLLVMLVALAIGFAAANKTITITGTAKYEALQYANMDDVTVKSAAWTAYQGLGVVPSAPVIEGNTVTANVQFGEATGKAKLSVTIQNTGSVPVKLSGLQINAPEGLTVKGPEPVLTDDELAGGAECTIDYIVSPTDTKDGFEGDKIFTITYNYDQTVTPKSEGTIEGSNGSHITPHVTPTPGI